MHSSARRFALAFTSLAMLLGTAACGGGGDDAADQSSAAGLDSGRATALGRRTPAPPPPAPAPAPSSDSTLALASASAAGQAVTGNVCGVSSDGGKVLFTSYSDALTSGDPTPQAEDIYLKNFNGNGVTRVVAGTGFCLALTPDANTVVYSLGNPVIFSPIWVKNLTTGAATLVTPPLNAFPNVTGYQFAGVSDDGLRVAFIAQPTRTCSGYDCIANGPARMLLRDLATGALINLEDQVRFTTSQGVANGEAWLSPNGRTLAFSSGVDYPQVGDTNAKGDVFALDIASGNVQLVSTNAAGQQLSIPGFGGGGSMWGVHAFLSNSSKIAFYSDYDTSAGPAGVYVKDLVTGALNRILDRNITYRVGSHLALSFSDDGRRVSYVESNGLGGSFATSLPRVRDIATGALVNAATLTNGTVGNGQTTTSVLLSRDGRIAAFGNNSTNLLGGVSPLGGAELRAYRKLLP